MLVHYTSCLLDYLSSCHVLEAFGDYGRGKKRRFQIHNSHARNDKVGEWLLIAVISEGSGTFGKLSAHHSDAELKNRVRLIKKQKKKKNFIDFQKKSVDIVMIVNERSVSEANKLMYNIMYNM